MGLKLLYIIKDFYGKGIIGLRCENIGINGNIIKV